MFLAYVYVCFLHRHQTKLLLFLLLVVNIFVSLYQYTLVLYCTASFRINIWFVCVLNRYAFKYTSIHQSSSSQLKSQFIYFHIYYCVVLRVYIAYFCDPIAHTFYDIFSSFLVFYRNTEPRFKCVFLVQLLLFTIFFHHCETPLLVVPIKDNFIIMISVNINISNFLFYSVGLVWCDEWNV